jgi:PST family polysaccharide transporter
VSKPLFKATSLNGISILLKVTIGFITSKVIAVFVGPSGMALVGNLRNFITSTEAIATLGFENGVVKYVAENKKEEKKLKQTLSTIFLSVLIVSIVLSFILFFFSDYFNSSIFGVSYHYNFVFQALAFALPFYIGNIFLIAAINGLGEFKKVIYINSIGSIIGLIVTLILIYKLKTQGALLAIILTPTLLFFVSFLSMNKEVSIFKSVHIKLFNFSFLKSLSSYSLMALVSAVFGPMVLLAIRKNIILDLGIEQAGFWEAMTRMSSYYFVFISSLIGIYFLPKLAIAKDNQETKSLFWEYYKGILPIFMFGMVTIYFFRDFIIQLLFTKQFLPISKLFFWQLIGDTFKAASFILGYQFYAKKLTKDFILFELLSLTVLYFSSIYFISIFKIEGVVMAYAFTYAIYLLSLAIYFRKSLF